jgi:hypothetical protein
VEPKNLNNQHKKSSKRQTNTPTGGYDTIAFVHNKFSSLVSSGAAYSLQYTPKKKQIIK